MSQYKYFMFSSQQYSDRLAIEKRIGKVYEPGTVVYKGKRCRYTEIVTDPESSRYADAQLVAEGYLDKLQYTPSTHNWG